MKLDREQVREKLPEMLEACCNGTYSLAEEVKAHIAEFLSPQNIEYMTGDTHGSFFGCYF